MKRIIEDTDASGLDALMGERVLLMCANYFYEGKLTGVNETFVELEDAHIVYETGQWSDKKWADRQKLHTAKWQVKSSFIESFGVSK